VVVHCEHHRRRPVEVLAELDGLSLFVSKREAFRERRSELLVDPDPFEFFRRVVGALGVGGRDKKSRTEKNERQQHSTL